MRLFGKVLSIALACCLLSSLLISWHLIRQTASHEREELLEERRAVARMIAAEIEKGYQTSYWPFETLSRIAQTPGFSFWWIVRDDGIIHLADQASSMGHQASSLYPHLRLPPAQEQLLWMPERESALLLEPLSLGEKRWFFVLGFSTRRITQQVRQTVLQASAVSAFLFIFFAIFLFLALRRQARPLAALTATVARLREGNFDIRAEIEGEDEIAELAESFNRAIEHLQRTTVSRDYLDSILDNMREGVVVVDAQGRIQDVNRPLCSLLGYREEELLHRPVREIIQFSPSDGSLPPGAHRSLPEGEMKGKQLNAHLLPHEGGSLPVLLGISPLPGEANQGNGSIWVAVDIRERLEMEEALRRSEERFRIAAQNCSDLVYEWQLATGHIEWFGDIDDLLGYGPGEFPRTLEAWENILHPQDRERVLASLRRSLDMGGRFREEYRVVRRDGGLRTWIDVGTALRDQQGHPVRMVGACTDVTDLRRAEEERKQLIHSLQEALSSIKTLRGLIPICSRCKKIRNDQGYWQQVEVYVREHSQADFTHGLCPDCFQDYLAELRRLREFRRKDNLGEDAPG